MMKLTRWILAPREADGRPAAIDLLRCAVGLRLEFDDGTALYEVEMDAPLLAELQANPKLFVLASLTAPASSLPVAVRARFDSEIAKAQARDPRIAGVASSDDVQQVLRRLRDAKGATFSVDKPF